jgi:hypothetical protein
LLRYVVAGFSPRSSLGEQTQAKACDYIRLRVFSVLLCELDETDHVLVKIDTRAVKDIKLGLGLVVSIDDETEQTKEWLKVNDEVWLPKRNDSRLKARAFMAKGYNVRVVEEFSDYKKGSLSRPQLSSARMNCISKYA